MSRYLIAIQGIILTWISNWTITDINDILSAIVTAIIGIVTVYKVIRDKRNSNSDKKQ